MINFPAGNSSVTSRKPVNYTTMRRQTWATNFFCATFCNKQYSNWQQDPFLTCHWFQAAQTQPHFSSKQFSSIYFTAATFKQTRRQSDIWNTCALYWDCSVSVQVDPTNLAPHNPINVEAPDPNTPGGGWNLQHGKGYDWVLHNKNKNKKKKN